MCLHVYIAKTGFNMSFKLSPLEAIQNLFSGENDENTITLSSAKSTRRIVKVKASLLVRPRNLDILTTRTEQINIFITIEAEAEGWDPVKLAQRPCFHQSHPTPHSQ